MALKALIALMVGFGLYLMIWIAVIPAVKKFVVWFRRHLRFYSVVLTDEDENNVIAIGHAVYAHSSMNCPNCGRQAKDVDMRICYKCKLKIAKIDHHSEIHVAYVDRKPSYEKVCRLITRAGKHG